MWVHVTTEDIAAKIPHGARIIPGEPDQAADELPFYAWHPMFQYWYHQELFQLAGADDETRYMVGVTDTDTKDEQ